MGASQGRSSEKCAALGLREFLVSDPRAELPVGVEATSVEEICREADYISLHAPLSPETHHIIDARRLSLCKPTAVIVNTGRGPLIDENALHNSLASGRLFGAALDVFEHEPPARDNPLFKLPNVVLSDHGGWYSENP